MLKYEILESFFLNVDCFLCGVDAHCIPAPTPQPRAEGLSPASSRAVFLRHTVPSSPTLPSSAVVAGRDPVLGEARAAGSPRGSVFTALRVLSPPCVSLLWCQTGTST